MEPLKQELLHQAAADELSDADVWRTVEKFTGDHDRAIAFDMVSSLIEAGLLRIHMLADRKVLADEPMRPLLQQLGLIWTNRLEDETIFTSWFVLTDEGRKSVQHAHRT